MRLVKIVVNWTFLLSIPFWVLPWLVYTTIGKDELPYLKATLKGSKWAWKV